MKISKHQLLFPLVIGFLLSSLQLNAQAFSLPVSDRVVELELQFPDQRVAKVVVRDGTLLTIQSDGIGKKFGLAAYFEQPGDVSPRLAPFKLFPYFGGESAEYLNGKQPPKEVPQGQSISVLTDLGRIQAKVVQIKEGYFPSIRPLGPDSKRLDPSELIRLYGKGAGGTCCVSCGSLTVCASEVSMWCGNCESGGSSGRLPV